MKRVVLTEREKLAERIVAYFRKHGLLIDGVRYAVYVVSKGPIYDELIREKRKNLIGVGGHSSFPPRIAIDTRIRGLERLQTFVHEVLHCVPWKEMAREEAIVTSGEASVASVLLDAFYPCFVAIADEEAKKRSETDASAERK